MTNHMAKFYNFLSIISLQMKPICWIVMPEMSSRVITVTLMAWYKVIISFTFIYCSGLLNVCSVINSNSFVMFKKIWNTQNCIQDKNCQNDLVLWEINFLIIQIYSDTHNSISNILQWFLSKDWPLRKFECSIPFLIIIMFKFTLPIIDISKCTIIIEKSRTIFRFLWINLFAVIFHMH